MQLWLSGIDPGLIRLLTAGRAALALLSIWLGLRLGLLLIYGKVMPSVPLFGVVSGIVLLLFIIDLRPAERKVSLGLATPLLAAALLLGSSLAGLTWITIFSCSRFSSWRTSCGATVRGQASWLW